MEHTKQKWETHPVTDTHVVYAVVDGKAEEICRTPSITPTDKANARRIVAAVNACEGIETEWLETGVNLKSQINDATKERNKAYNAVMAEIVEKEFLRAQNARLLEALKEITETLLESDGGFAVGEGNIKDAWNTARAAIAEAETNHQESNP